MSIPRYISIGMNESQMVSALDVAEVCSKSQSHARMESRAVS